MNITRFRLIAFLALSLLLLVAVVAFGQLVCAGFGICWNATAALSFPAAIQSGRAAHYVLLPSRSRDFPRGTGSRVSLHDAFAAEKSSNLPASEIGQQYAIARVLSYLVFALGLIVGLQSLGLNLSSLVVVGGALGIGVGLGLQAIVSNFVAGLILLLEQPIKLGDRIEVGNTYGDVVRLRGRSTWIRTNETRGLLFPTPSSLTSASPIGQRTTDGVRCISLPVGVSYNKANCAIGR